MNTDQIPVTISLDGQSWTDMITTVEDQAKIVAPGDKVSVSWPADHVPDRACMVELLGVVDRHRMDMTTKTVTHPASLGPRMTLVMTLTKRLQQGSV